MIILTHFLATTLILKLMSVTDPKLIFFSYFFGVFIDLDELYTVYKYWKQSKSWKDFKEKFFKKGLKRRTWFQESGSLTFSLIISIIFRSVVPFLCNLIHCLMDWFSVSDSRPLAPYYNRLKIKGPINIGGLEEIILIVILIILFLL